MRKTVTLSPDLTTEDYGEATRLAMAWRGDFSPEMERRRWVIGLSLAGAGLGMLGALAQVGALRRLPQIKAGAADADRSETGAYLYKRAKTPDGLLTLASYGITAVLAGMGGPGRARTAPWLPVALAAKCGYDLFVATRLTREGLRDRGAVGFTQTTTLTSLASLAIAAVDAWSAVQTTTEVGRQKWPEVRQGAVDRGRSLRERSMGLAGRMPGLRGRFGEARVH